MAETLVVNTKNDSKGKVVDNIILFGNSNIEELIMGKKITEALDFIVSDSWEFKRLSSGQDISTYSFWREENLLRY